jgi:hypothetical protein
MRPEKDQGVSRDMEYEVTQKHQSGQADQNLLADRRTDNE